MAVVMVLSTWLTRLANRDPPSEKPGRGPNSFANYVALVP